MVKIKDNIVNKKNLPYLLELIDDETEEVRKEILRQLNDYGGKLEEDLSEYKQGFSSEKFKIIKPIIDRNRREWLMNHWFEWDKEKGEYAKLFQAMNMITRYQYGATIKDELNIQFDNLASKFKKKYFFGNEIDLAQYLFQEVKLVGEKQNYYNPFNSNLLHVINKKKGIPISLTLIYMLVGDRLGFTIEGCNFPGHFLAKIELDNELILVDGFNGGKLIFERDLYELEPDTIEAVTKIVKMHTSSRMIVRRVLNNLVNAYTNIKDQTNADFFTQLLHSTPI